MPEPTLRLSDSTIFSRNGFLIFLYIENDFTVLATDEVDINRELLLKSKEICDE